MRARSPQARRIFLQLSRRWVIALLIALPLVAFWPSLMGNFVEWDDRENFLGNQGFRGLGWANIRWAFTAHQLGVFQPLSWLLLEAEYCLWALQPIAYHAVSLALHAVNAWLLFGLVQRLLEHGRPQGQPTAAADTSLAAGAATLLFAIHPLRVETVAWISCQPYELSFLFSFLSLRAYLRWQGDGAASGARWGGLTFLCVVSAMASKAVAVTLPLLFLVLDAYPLRRLRRDGGTVARVLKEKAAFFAAAGFFAYQALRARGDGVVPLASDGVSQRLAQAAYGTLFYLGKTILPVRLSPYYPLSSGISLAQPAYLACGVALVGITAAVLRWGRRWHPLECRPRPGTCRSSDRKTDFPA